MPTTRKRVIKTIYKDEESGEENEGHDFSDSGSEAVISDQETSDDEEECVMSSDDDFKSMKMKRQRPRSAKKVVKTKFSKAFISKIDKQNDSEENIDVTPALFSVKDLTDSDKLLPSILNLSESDSSDDESPKAVTKKFAPLTVVPEKDDDSDNETNVEYKDVWAKNVQDESEEIAKRTFMELEQHKSKIEETKTSIQNYSVKMETQPECDVKDLLALGEEEIPQPSISSPKILKRGKKKKPKDDSDSEMEDWEEVNEAKGIPQQGLQLVVDIPNSVCRKTKKVDVEMMMKRKINRVKKEYQVYMHKVHVLCWLGHGNFVSSVLNNQTIMAASLSLVPSKECYPGERVDMKYIEQITTWFKEKVTLKQDKHENKFRPKAAPLKEILQQQIKSRVFTTKKYIVFVFVSMLRSLGLQCRVMFNFITLPIKPPSSELCSLSTKPTEKNNDKKGKHEKTKKASPKLKKESKDNIPQLDGIYDMSCSSDSDNIMQVDGSDDSATNKGRRPTKSVKDNTKKHLSSDTKPDDSVSPPKRARISRKQAEDDNKNNIEKTDDPATDKLKITRTKITRKSLSLNRTQTQNTESNSKETVEKPKEDITTAQKKKINRAVEQTDKKLKKPITKNGTSVNEATEKETNTSNKVDEQTDKKLKKPVTKRYASKDNKSTEKEINKSVPKKSTLKVPEIVVTNENESVKSRFFENKESPKKISPPVTRRRAKTSESVISNKTDKQIKNTRTRSAEGNTESKYFNTNVKQEVKKKADKKTDKDSTVSHKDLQRRKVRNDVKDDLVHIIKKRVKEAKEDEKKLMVKGKNKKESDEDSDYLPIQSPKRKKSESDDDFKPMKINPKPRVGVKKVDRRVLSTDDETSQNTNKSDVWCEVFVEELEEWIAVDVIKGSVHCINEVYTRSTHPVTYVVGWDNNNYLKDLTRKYVPHWNTVTRKQRVDPYWWEVATKPWLGPKTARDREEDERLDRMQLEAPLPKAISEYKNHPLYALKRHLLKFEAIYPPDAATLGFVRGEAVYARECVYVCRSRDTWLKEAKVVKLGEQPYKVVKARPKWDKLSNKVITDKPLEVFGPWQVQDYEPPTAENGIVPRNAYGNVELFKDCMLPKGTVHLKLPGLNRVAKKFNIDCAPAMVGFDFNGGWTHPVFEGFVVCKEFAEDLTEAWIKVGITDGWDQEEQERKEQEKTEARVYGNWRRLIRGLLIKERLKAKYGFEEPSTSQEKKKKGPKLVVKKK